MIGVPDLKNRIILIPRRVLWFLVGEFADSESQEMGARRLQKYRYVLRGIRTGLDIQLLSAGPTGNNYAIQRCNRITRQFLSRL